MRLISTFLRGLLPLALVTSTAIGAMSSEPSDLQKVLDANVVRVGAVQAPPWYDKDLASGEWTGIVPDVMRAIFDKPGVKVTYVETQWGTAVAGLQSDRFDLLGAYNATPERQKVIDFTKPMGALKFAILTLKGPAAAYATWDKIDDPAISSPPSMVPARLARCSP